MIMEPPATDSGEGGGGGTHKRVKEEWTMVMEGKKKTVEEASPSIKASLGNCEQNLVIKYVNPVLTAAQFLEFQQQALIFEHMKSGLPIPLHLVIPIQSKVSKSLGIGPHRHLPVAGLGPRKVDHRNMLDPELGRCRRTDGNKWRCKMNVVPNQKYCERHMHRGRQRSRKHVEASEIENSSGTNSPKHSESLKIILSPSQNVPHPQAPLPSILIPHGDLENSKTVPPLSQLMTPYSSNTSNITITASRKDGNKTDSMFLGEFCSNNVFRGGINSSITVDVASNSSLSTTSSIPIMTNTNNHDINDCINSANSPIFIDTAAASSFIPSRNSATLSIPNSGPSFTTSSTPTTSDIKRKNSKSIAKTREGCTSANNLIMRHSKSGNSGNVGNSVSTGFSFSPKSVLQVIGCRGSGFYRINVELEPGRCRRTDGKKWRCSHAVVADNKYCEKHMHRGAKKRVEASLPLANLTTSACPPHTMITSNKADSATRLYSSIPESPQPTTNDAKSPSSSSSSSDATISDTTITANENSNFSS